MLTKLRLTLSIMAVLVAALSCTPVMAQEMCGKRADIIARIFGKFDEVKNAHGILPNGTGLVEVFSAQTGEERTFTIITTFPNGTSCVHLIGSDWRYVYEPGPST